ncbi:MAG: hypothetical protein ACREE0_19180, partial [Phenylobacterium sp.]
RAMNFDPRDLVWPVLNRNLTQEAQDAEAAKATIAHVRATNWGSNIPMVLVEAQKLAETEADRRRSADNKAAIYLAAVAAIVPLLASTETVFWDNSVETAPRALAVPVLILALLYLSAAALWAVRTLRVSGIGRVDVETFLEPRGRGGLGNHLANEHLAAAMHNRAGTNQKITYLKMSHEFILRAAVTFAALLALEASWAPAIKLMKLVCLTT